MININDWDELINNPILGNSWEGYVVEQIIQNAGNKLYSHYYRTQDGAECDLVMIKAGKPVAGIEIKYTSSPKITKSMLESFNDLNTHMNYIVTPNTDDYLIKENIRVCNLPVFLMDYLPEI